VSRYSLRKAGGSVMVRIPPAYLKQNGLTAGSAVEVEEHGGKLVITPAKTRVTLADILKAAPKNARTLRVEGWDDMTPVGNEA
jgi:antitoxin ChpS